MFTADQTQGVRLQPEFAGIRAGDPDLMHFALNDGKMVMYQGLEDEYIPAQRAIYYYGQLLADMGWDNIVQPFFRLYLIPSFMRSGCSEGAPSVPVPQSASGRDEIFRALQAWVKRDMAPVRLNLISSNDAVLLPT